jgi:ubiquinone/menaquinone biosynthesis C-methylase UbiE
LIHERLRRLTLAKYLLPKSVRPLAKGWLARAGFASLKYSEELNYWRKRFRNGSWTLRDYYEERLLALARENSQQFIEGKVVGDFGCGPRGSLCWATSARCRIGIDVLADLYSEFDIANQDMVYVVSSERNIPLPSGYLDVLFCMNALDHTSHLSAMCRELIRIMKPGGTFVASFNLLERGTFSEPQTLDEDTLDELLLHRFAPLHREITGDSKHKLEFRGIKK